MLSPESLTDATPLNDNAARAFPPHPRLDRYFPSAAAEEARTRLTSCVERGEGPALLVGSAGAGKTMLLEVLSETFKDRFAVAPLAGGQLCTRRALLQSLLHALDLPYREREEGELRLAIKDYLQDTQACPAGVLLLVDEAQALTPRLLEELRVLGNQARSGEPVVRLVLAGTTALEERLAAPELETLNQRIAARCYLSPMAYDEVAQYIRAHIAATGANPDELLSVDAAAAVFEATDGIPRLVNQLCDRAIVLAVAAGAGSIDRAAIQNAWSDLHQLPAPWHSPDPQAFAAPTAEPVEPASADQPSLALAEDATVEAAPQEIVEADTTPINAVWNADAALSQVLTVEPMVVCSLGDETPVALPEPKQPERAADPFADDFEEEETMLDPYAGFESPFPAGTPIVSNQEDGTISTLVATLASGFDVEEETELDEPESEALAPRLADEPLPAGEPTIADSLPSVIEQPSDLGAVGLPFPVEQAVASDEPNDCEEESPQQAAAIDVDEDPAVLLIEDDPADASSSSVYRQEYRQLFASLRGG